MTKQKDPNYSEAQEARIRQAADEGELNAEVAAVLADEFGKTARSVIAKIVRMNLPYATKQRTTKTGEPIVSKTKLVEQISAVVGANLEGLEKAPKPALQALARFTASSD